MKPEFRPVNVNDHFSVCMAFRRDAFVCTFQSDHGFASFIRGYEERMRARLVDPRWYYIHIWENDQIIGQLEFKSYSDQAETGYIHLIYLIPEYRGSGVADAAQRFMADTLSQAMLLTVSRTNERALRHYRRWGWQRVGEDGSLRGTDIYRRDIRIHQDGEWVLC